MAEFDLSLPGRQGGGIASSGVNQDQVCHLPFLRGTSLTYSEKNTSKTSETFCSNRHMIWFASFQLSQLCTGSSLELCRPPLK